MNDIKRIGFEFLLMVLLMFLFIEDIYTLLPNPVQLIGLKVLIVSIAVLHAHIIGKLFIPNKVNWTLKLNEQSGGFYARLSLYIIIPICYAIGG